MTELDHYGRFEEDRRAGSCGPWTSRRNPYLYATAVLTAGVVALAVGLIVTGAAKHGVSPAVPPTVPPTLKFFQLTDIHLDPYLYAEHGARSTVCGATNVARVHSNPNIACSNFCRNVTMPAGKNPCGATGVTGAPYTAPFGRMGCDSPKALLDSAIGAMQKVNPNPAFIALTGDMAAHNLCTSGPGTPPSDCTKDSQDHNAVVQAITTVIQALTAAFPNSPILPMFGNNDTPEHYITPLGADRVQYMSAMSALWKPAIQCSTCQQQVAANFTEFDSAGFYSVSEIVPGLRVLALNTLLFGEGLDQMYIVDAGGAAAQDEAARRQLAWLESELVAAKAAGQQVILASHIPPGMQPYNGKPNWNATYQQPFFSILAKYPEVQPLQLYGHFHYDTFRVFPLSGTTGSACAVNEDIVSSSTAHDYVGNAARTVSMLAPGVSPVYYNNPAFRQYHMDPVTNQVIDYDQYWLDLQAANFLGNDQQQWSLEYTFSSLYNTTLSADNLCSVATKMGTNSRAWASYAVVRAMTYFPFRYRYMCAMTTLTQQAYADCIAQTATYSPGDHWPM